MRVPGGYFHVDEIPKNDEEAFEEFKGDIQHCLDEHPLFTIEYV